MTAELVKLLIADLQGALEAESALARLGLLVMADHDLGAALEYATLEARRQLTEEGKSAKPAKP